MDAKMRAVLLVDDQEGIVNALRRELRDWATECSLEILTALSARQGLEILEQRGGDTILVISDLHMPEMKGIEFLGKVKTAHPDIVPILMTGNSDEAELAVAEAVGIFGFISKPWESAYLIAEVRKACAYAEARRELASMRERDEEDLGLAAVLRRKLLETSLPAPDGLRFELSHRQAPNLRGGADYFDLIRPAPDRYLLILGSIDGPGLQAALVAGILRALMASENGRTREETGSSPGAFLAWLNGRLHMELGKLPCPALAFFAGLLDLRPPLLRYATSGLAPPLLLREGKAIELAATGPAFGASESAAPVEAVAELAPGDLLLLHTDLLVESAGAAARRPIDIKAIVEGVAYGGEYHRRLLEALVAEAGGAAFAEDLTLLSAKIL